MSEFRRAAGLIASVLLLLMGLGILFIPGLPLLLRLVLAGVGVVMTAYQWTRYRATRPDPYDLKTLWDAPFPGEPEPEADEDAADELDRELDIRVCLNCGHGVPPPFARCPECGQVLR